MNRGHRTRRRINSQLVGSTTMKKMAKVIVGKSMGGAHSRASAPRDPGASHPTRHGMAQPVPAPDGRTGVDQRIWYTIVTSTDTVCEPGFTGGAGAVAAPGIRRAPDAATGGPTGTPVEEIESSAPSDTPAAPASCPAWSCARFTASARAAATMLLLSSKLNERLWTTTSFPAVLVAASTTSPALLMSRSFAVTVLSTSYPSTWLPDGLSFGEIDRSEVWTSLSATPASFSTPMTFTASALLWASAVAADASRAATPSDSSSAFGVPSTTPAPTPV